MKIKVNNSYSNFLKLTMFTLTFVIVNTVYAKADTDPSKMPSGCYNDGYTFHHKNLTLMPVKSGSHDSVYFVYNDSGYTINMYQLKSEKENMGLNINNKIRPYNWGVYSSNESLVRFACSIPSKKYDHGALVACKQYLKVCEYTNVKYGLNNKGNYWMSRSNTRGGALRRVNRLGVLLRN